MRPTQKHGRLCRLGCVCVLGVAAVRAGRREEGRGARGGERAAIVAGRRARSDRRGGAGEDRKAACCGIGSTSITRDAGKRFGLIRSYGGQGGALPCRDEPAGPSDPPGTHSIWGPHLVLRAWCTKVHLYTYVGRGACGCITDAARCGLLRLHASVGPASSVHLRAICGHLPWHVGYLHGEFAFL